MRKLDKLIGLSSHIFFISFLFAFILVLVVFSVAIIDTAYHHYQQVHSQETRQWPPAIPVCDKELWERVKGDCDELHGR